MCRARDRIWDSRMPGNVMGTTEQLVSTFFFEIKTVTKEEMTYA